MESKSKYSYLDFITVLEYIWEYVKKWNKIGFAFKKIFSVYFQTVDKNIPFCSQSCLAVRIVVCVRIQQNIFAFNCQKTGTAFFFKRVSLLNYIFLTKVLHSNIFLDMHSAQNKKVFSVKRYFLKCACAEYMLFHRNQYKLLFSQVQDAFRCRLRNCQDPINADSSSSFPNGHAQIMVSFYFYHWLLN